MPTDSTAQAATLRDRTRWIALVVVCLAMLMSVIDTSIVNVALPAIQRDLGSSQATLTWVVDAYLIAFGSFLLLAGRLGDLIGRKRVFLVGVAIFTLSSAVCAVADSQALLIGARFVQGFGGAVSSSVIMALIVTEFPRPDDRAKAMSAYVLVSVGGGSLGLLLGGVLTEAISWHWIFAINLPIGLVTLLLGQVLLEDDRGAGLGERLDVLGSVLVTAALMIGIYAIVRVPEEGWTSSTTIGYGVIAIVLLAAFLIVEARTANPIMPLRVLRIRGLVWACVGRGCISAGMFTVLFLGALSLATVHGFDAIETGLAFLPTSVVVTVMSIGITSRLIARFGARRMIPVGMTMVIGSLLLLSTGDEQTRYFPSIFVSFALLGLGINTAMVPLLTVAMKHVPDAEAGIGSGIVNISMQFSAALGVAVFGTIAADHTRALRADGEPLTAALTAGYSLAFLLAACLVALALVFVLGMLRATRSEAHQREAREPARA